MWILAEQEFLRHASQTAHTNGKGSESHEPVNNASCQYNQVADEMAGQHQSCSVCEGEEGKKVEELSLFYYFAN